MHFGRMIFRYSPGTATSNEIGLVTRQRSSAFRVREVSGMHAGSLEYL
jgi:hypothetical protein